MRLARAVCSKYFTDQAIVNSRDTNLARRTNAASRPAEAAGRTGYRCRLERTMRALLREHLTISIRSVAIAALVYGTSSVATVTLALRTLA